MGPEALHYAPDAKTAGGINGPDVSLKSQALSLVSLLYLVFENRSWRVSPTVIWDPSPRSLAAHLP